MLTAIDHGPGTDGRYCDSCLPLFNNKPFLPGTPGKGNHCVACDCNQHAARCVVAIKQLLESDTFAGPDS